MDLGIEPLSRYGSRQSHEAGQMLEFGNCETRQIGARQQQRDTRIGSDRTLEVLEGLICYILSWRIG